MRGKDRTDPELAAALARVGALVAENTEAVTALRSEVADIRADVAAHQVRFDVRVDPAGAAHDERALLQHEETAPQAADHWRHETPAGLLDTYVNAGLSGDKAAKAAERFITAGGLVGPVMTDVPGHPEQELAAHELARQSNAERGIA